MPNFAFQANDRSGRRQAGTLEAVSQVAVAQQLRQRGWLVLRIQPAAANESLGSQLAKLDPRQWMPPRSVDIELSCKQLAVMLRGGLTLLVSLQTLAAQSGRASLRRAWHQVAMRLQEGASMADSLTECKCFPSILVQLVRVGEQTGSLEQAVERAADTLENRRRVRSSLLTALSYPALVFVAAIGVTAYMVVGVIPKLRTFLEGMGRKLPAMTQMLLDISSFVQNYIVHFAIGVLILTVSFAVIYFNPLGRVVVDRWLLRVPLIGQLFRLAGTATFARALGILIRSGITLLEGLRTTEELLTNRYLASRVSAARQAVMQGGALGEPLALEHAFTPLLARMVTVGESAGTMDDVLDEVARFHEAQLQVAIRQLSAIVEPMIIVVVGGIVGFVYISFFVALFSAGGG